MCVCVFVCRVCVRILLAYIICFHWLKIAIPEFCEWKVSTPSSQLWTFMKMIAQLLWRRLTKPTTLFDPRTMRCGYFFLLNPMFRVVLLWSGALSFFLLSTNTDLLLWLFLSLLQNANGYYKHTFSHSFNSNVGCPFPISRFLKHSASLITKSCHVGYLGRGRNNRPKGYVCSFYRDFCFFCSLTEMSPWSYNNNGWRG